MNNIEIFDVQFPARSESVFDKIVLTGWYDGITGAIASQTRSEVAFRIDIVAWGPSEWQRIFALSPFDLQSFDSLVSLMAPDATETWPKRDPEWPSGTPEDKTLNAKMDTVLNTAGRPT